MHQARMKKTANYQPLESQEDEVEAWPSTAYIVIVSVIFDLVIVLIVNLEAFMILFW